MKILLTILFIGVALATCAVAVLAHQVVTALISAFWSVLGLWSLSRQARARIGLFAVALMACLPARADGPTTNQLVLTWDVLPEYSTNDTFYIYSSTNAVQPMTQWLAVTSITYKAFMVNTNVPIPPATDVKRFYTFVSSNFTGRSDFAEPDSCRRLPSGSGTRIGPK